MNMLIIKLNRYNTIVYSTNPGYDKIITKTAVQTIKISPEDVSRFNSWNFSKNNLDNGFCLKNVYY